MKNKFRIALALLLGLYLVSGILGCAPGQTATQQTAQTIPDSIGNEQTEQKENDEMKTQPDLVKSLMEQLGCGERTAASILDTFTLAGIADMESAAVIESNGYMILEIHTASGTIYYATIGLGYSVDTIREGSRTGTIIYREMA